jgi:aspartate/glutamate racemase
MKTVGIIGGIAPESTVAYYRLIIAAYRELNYSDQTLSADQPSVFS